MNKKIICPHCKSYKTRKEGKQKNKFQIIQKYKCNLCKKYFSENTIKFKTYPSKIIITSISYYNLGYSQNKTKNLINKRFKTKVSQKTISNWISQYKSICTFHKLRKKAIRLYSPNKIITKTKLQHNQIYKFQLHNAKLKLLEKYLTKRKFSLLKKYLEKISTNKFPHHIFKSKKIKSQLPRASQIKFPTLKIKKYKKQNLANKLAELGLMLAKTKKQRHQKIQNFMLINDSVTLAAELPVYLNKNDIRYFKKRKFKFNLNNYKTPITGHIDLIQIRNNLIHILDYKPDAKNQNPIEQLTLYALALASKTKLALKDFKCAWFDEKNYFEFFPLHTVYKNKIF
jgi:transposase-like protein